jgi:biopolymer transport protein ExbD
MAIKSLGSIASESEDPGIVAEINITPLTDIFLVLLIIFMVTSSVMSQLGVNVNLPNTSTATSQSQPEGTILTLLPSGDVSVNGKSVARSGGGLAAMEASLKAAFAKTSSRLVILEGDRKAFLGSAIEVMDAARRAGADRFAIAASVSPSTAEK